MAPKLADKIGPKPDELADKDAANGSIPLTTNGSHSSSGAEGNKAVLMLDAAYRENYQELLAYARSRVGSQAAAQDVVQQAFANTMGAIDRGAKINYMPGFLQRCVSNLCISNSRREQPESIEGQLHRVRQTGKSAEDSAELHEQMRDINLVLNEMPSSQRYAFLQAELRGIEQKEIAREMDRSIGSVRQLVHRARHQVRTRVAPGRVAGWWWPFSRLRKKDRREKRRGSFAFVGIQLATLGSWLTRVFQASANTLLQPQAPIALAAIMFIVAGVWLASPGTKDLPPVAASSISQPSHATSDSQKYIVGFSSQVTDSTIAASAGDSADSLYIESSNRPNLSSNVTPSTAGQESGNSAAAKSGNTETTPLNLDIADPAAPTEPPVTDPQAPVPNPGQTTPAIPDGKVTTDPDRGSCTVADTDCDGFPDSPPPSDTDGDGSPG